MFFSLLARPNFLLFAKKPEPLWRNCKSQLRPVNYCAGWFIYLGRLRDGNTWWRSGAQSALHFVPVSERIRHEWRSFRARLSFTYSHSTELAREPRLKPWRPLRYPESRRRRRLFVCPRPVLSSAHLVCLVLCTCACLTQRGFTPSIVNFCTVLILSVLLSLFNNRW